MRAACFAAFVAFALPAAAQDTTQIASPSVNVHITQASGSTIEGSGGTTTLGASTGWGISLGYGFNKWLSMYTTADAAGSQSVSSNGTLNGSLTLYQMDAGVRIQYPLARNKVIPYGLLAYSSRLLSGPGNTLYYGSGTLSIWGGAMTYGAGIQLFMSRNVALDLSYTGSSGTYARVQYPDGYGFNTSAGSTTSSRFAGGVTWQVGPVGPPVRPAPPSGDTMVVGEAVRLRVGSVIVDGDVIALHRDTVIIQRVHKDTATQVEVPRECIATVERLLPIRSMKSGIVNGAFVGAVAGSLVGIAVRNAQSKAPSTFAGFLGTYVLGGAVLGGAAGAIFNHDVDRWQQLHFEPVPSTVDSREAACRSWHKPS
jgi:hypothetical protein